jgi:hypothetical protein
LHCNYGMLGSIYYCVLHCTDVHLSSHTVYAQHLEDICSYHILFLSKTLFSIVKLDKVTTLESVYRKE